MRGDNAANEESADDSGEEERLAKSFCRLREFHASAYCRRLDRLDFGQFPGVTLIDQPAGHTVLQQESFGD